MNKVMYTSNFFSQTHSLTMVEELSCNVNCQSFVIVSTLLRSYPYTMDARLKVKVLHRAGAYVCIMVYTYDNNIYNNTDQSLLLATHDMVIISCLSTAAAYRYLLMLQTSFRDIHLYDQSSVEHIPRALVGLLAHGLKA